LLIKKYNKSVRQNWTPPPQLAGRAGAVGLLMVRDIPPSKELEEAQDQLIYGDNNVSKTVREDEYHVVKYLRKATKRKKLLRPHFRLPVRTTWLGYKNKDGLVVPAFQHPFRRIFTHIRRAGSAPHVWHRATTFSSGFKRLLKGFKGL